MILQGPSPVIVTPGNVQVRVHYAIDSDAGTISASYGPDGGQGAKQVSAPMPVALRTALDNWAKGAIETAEGWAAGSSTIITP